MAVTEGQDTLLEDLKSAIISEMIVYEFYSRSSGSVKIISGMHAFEDMMSEEKIHVTMLKEEYERLGGSDDLKYDPHKHGGVALPNLEADATVALELAMTDELAGIKMYSDYVEKYRGTETVNLFEQLLNDEMKHLGHWDEIYKSITDKSFVPNRPGKPDYRFTPDDIEVILTAHRAEKAACDFYHNAIGKTEIIDGSHAFQHMAWEEKIHVEKLENEYFRLVNEKLQTEDRGTEDTINIAKGTDALVALELSIKEEKASLRRYLELEERCTNTRLREVIWELIESEWDHIKQWRETHKNIREQNFPLYTSHP